MNNKNGAAVKTDQALFNLIAIFWLVLMAGMFAGTASVNLMQFILASCFVLCMAAAYNLGLIPGLLFSLAFVFAYGTYLLYGVMFTGTISELRVEYVIWLFAVPIQAYLAGKLSGEVRRLAWEVEKIAIKNNYVTIDELTGFLNDQGFFKRLEEEVSRSHRFKNPLSVMVLMLANLAEVRAIYGRAGIESILKAVSGVIEETIRTIDAKGLINSETFAFILTGTPSEGARVVEEKINRSLERITVNVGGRKKVIKLKVRIGYAELGDGEEFLVFYDRALENTRYDMG
ncbi:MAG: GGDEF domain-containing protein [Bacillota bacterium]